MSAIPESEFNDAMNQHGVEGARALQCQPDPKKRFWAPAWEFLVESSTNYWRAKALNGECGPMMATCAKG